MDPATRDVAVLVAAAELGDEDAWHEIVDRYTSLIVSVVLPYDLSSADLQDVAQTVWLRLIEHVAELREPRALPTWLIITAKREALRSATASTRMQPIDPHDDVWAARLVSEGDQDADLVRSERHRTWVAGLTALSPPRAAVVHPVGGPSRPVRRDQPSDGEPRRRHRPDPCARTAAAAQDAVRSLRSPVVGGPTPR